MNKQLKQILLGSLVILLGIIIYYYFYSTDSEKTPSTDTNNLNSVSIDLINNKREVVTSSDASSLTTATSSDSKIVNTFESILSAGSGLDLIDSLFSQGRDGLALDLLKTLHERCGHIEGWEAPHEQSVWAYDKIVSYCQDYNSDLYDTWLNKPITNELYKPNYSSLVLGEEYSSLDVVSNEFLERITQAPSRRSMLDITRTMRSFSHGFSAPLQLGQSESVSSKDIYNIQRAAMHVYACQRFGGCGPDEFLTLEMCVLTSQCQQGWSLMDFYQNTLSPLNFTEVMNIVYEIQRLEEPKP